MKEHEVTNFSTYGCRLAATYCRNKYKNGGVCILAKKDINYQTIGLQQFCRDKVLEIYKNNTRMYIYSPIWKRT